MCELFYINSYLSYDNKGKLEMIKNLSLVFFTVFLAACAQVPRESVELSATIGRDIATTHQAHAQLATLLFARMKQDVNRFVDNTYAPYQISIAMNRQKELADSNEEEDNNKSLLLAINAAFETGAPEQLQSDVLKGMQLLVNKIRSDVEEVRAELLEPINEQEAQVIASINRAYQQLHYANSIVTGHLSSIVKVHDAQSDLLKEIGVEKNLRKDIGEKIANTSARITTIVDAAASINGGIDKAEIAAASLQRAVENLNNSIK